MTVEEVKNVISQFLETLDKQRLIKFNSKLWNNKFTKNFPYRTPIFVYVLHRILEQYDERKLGFQVTDEAMFIFVFTNIVNFITSNLEFVKKSLNVLIDKDKIEFDENITYGRLIGLICDKLRYNKIQRRTIRDNFFVGFRNGISHIQYTITKNGVSVDIDGQTIHFDSEKLNQLMDETSAVVNVFEQFANKKTVELETQKKELDTKLKEINRQINEQANKNAETRRKTEALSNEEGRIKRKTEKLKRNEEMINRKMAKKKKTTARIISKSNK